MNSLKYNWALLAMGCLCFAAKPSNALTTNIAHGKCDVAHSIHYVDPQKACDGDTSTVSVSQTTVLPNAIAAMAAITIDLGSAKPLYESVFHYDVYPSSRNYYKIQGSNDATLWTDVLRVWNPTFPKDIRLLPAVSYRYVRVVVPPFYPQAQGDVVQSNAPIKEIEIYERGAGDPVGDTPINYPTPFDRTGWSAKVNGNDYPQAVNKMDQGWLDPHGAGYVIGSKPEAIHEALKSGDHIIVDMGEKKTFNQIGTETCMDTYDTYSIYVSDDGVNWGNPILTQSRIYNLRTVTFSTQTARYIKYENKVNMP